ncbi:hypothetical protein [Mesonia aestuariivivens]|uniref:Periplasmic heavy metal sensor n=1 Tax=Mesonia aestuariivivens TaxID=2796128 RepID=A0ABS6VYH4_9FLAO|nr:hypothetical protein [Mesonia aestuariivivens]MBW2960657.1 hypothetical protein [Mesonia aestuariivivens]
MKKFILVCIAVFAFQFTHAQYRLAIAKATPQQEFKADKQSKMFTKKLGLNGEQPLLLKNKLLEFIVKKDEIVQSKDLSKEEKVANLKALRVNELKEMQDILTQPQYEQLLEVERNLREKRLEKGKDKN